MHEEAPGPVAQFIALPLHHLGRGSRGTLEHDPVREPSRPLPLSPIATSQVFD